MVTPPPNIFPSSPLNVDEIFSSTFVTPPILPPLLFKVLVEILLLAPEIIFPLLLSIEPFPLIIFKSLTDSIVPLLLLIVS